MSVLFQIQALLAAHESKLAEAKKQYDLMLESKQSELSRHLKEISQRNDQVISFTSDSYMNLPNGYFLCTKRGV